MEEDIYDEILILDDEPMSIDEILEKELRYLVRSSEDAKELKALVVFDQGRNHLLGWKLSDARKYLISHVGSASILSRLRNLQYVARHAYNDPQRYVLQNQKYILNWLERWFSGGTLSTDVAIKEKQEVVDAMRREYNNFITSVKECDVDEWCQQIKSVDDLINYTKHIMNGLYMDALLVFLQQYSMADTDIYSVSDSGKLVKRAQTGFSLAYYGDPGTGKTFATDDLLRGNEREGIPPHGIIGKLRYAEGMTPKQFIAILEAYQNYPVDWIIPEFRDFFRYQGMVEKLKLVMERREVTDETRTTKIGPYKVTSFFIVNYNLKLTKHGYKDTMSDPNFSAVEDRMICKLFLNTEKRKRLIFDNMMRISNGEVEFYLADTLRKHITYTYHYLVNERIPVVIDARDLQELGEWIIENVNKYAPNTSLRIINRALQIAASAEVISALHSNSNELIIHSKSINIAKEFIKQELASRSLKQ